LTKNAISFLVKRSFNVGYLLFIVKVDISDKSPKSPLETGYCEKAVAAILTRRCSF